MKLEMVTICKDDLDTDILLWLWPITLILAAFILTITFIIYGWLWVGNKIIDHTIGDKSPLS